MNEIEYIRERLDYNPHTGSLTWRTSHQARFVGKPAGHFRIAPVHEVVISLRGRQYKAHRLAWAITHGRWPRSFLDHINGDPHDNRLCNLREADYAQNSHNQARARNNTSGYKGVSWNKTDRCWRASVSCRGKRFTLGNYRTKEEAYAAYCEAAEKHHGEFARFK